MFAGKFSPTHSAEWEEVDLLVQQTSAAPTNHIQNFLRLKLELSNMLHLNTDGKVQQATATLQSMTNIIKTLQD